jgi:hypothetical protein
MEIWQDWIAEHPIEVVPDHKHFVDDMEEAVLEVRHYRGRFFWEGPAVVVDDLQDALGSTEVRCQWDNMGMGWVVYPREHGARSHRLEQGGT